MEKMGEQNMNEDTGKKALDDMRKALNGEKPWEELDTGDPEDYLLGNEPEIPPEISQVGDTTITPKRTERSLAEKYKGKDFNTFAEKSHPENKD